jgi:2-oxoglutarate ferredoxin oxidoreductase subunit beta
VFRSVSRPSYDGLVRDQLETAKLTVPAEDALAGLLNSGDTWTIL